jgi:hypothetical protein
MGFLSAAAIGVGTMIAAGIFVLSGLAVSKVGTVACDAPGSPERTPSGIRRRRER